MRRLSLFCLPFLLSSAAAQGPDAKTYDEVVAKAIKYLNTTQEKNGGWSTMKSPGVTGIVLTAMFKSGKVSATEPTRGSNTSRPGQPREEASPARTEGTAAELRHLGQRDGPRRRRPRRQVQGGHRRRRRVPQELQWDDGEGKTEADDYYGGAGYDSKSRRTCPTRNSSSTPSRRRGVPPSDPAYKKALVFVSRCQNLKTEANDKPWAGKINDGSFIYTAASGGVTKVVDAPLDDGSLPGYASMTYAGIKSMIYCGLTKKDDRVKKAFEWIQKHYSVDKNAGMPEKRAHWGLYYYYHTMAKSLDTLGVDYVVDDKGVKHDWRKDITEALARRQTTDGSFQNDSANWMEADQNLVTGYALMALSYCRPKSK
ncbi:MAG: hypothetical protein U0793_00320 [Gemmataceae bacterium]